MTPRSLLEDLVAGRVTIEEVLRVLGSDDPGGVTPDNASPSRPTPGCPTPSRPIPGGLASGGVHAESESVSRMPIGDSDHLHPDLERRVRTGIPEVVFAQRKTLEETVQALRALSSKGRGALATRVLPEQGARLCGEFPDGRWHERARIFELEDPERDWLPGEVAIVSAGTSDAAVAEEAAVTAEFLGSRALRVYDVGVAGLHRVLGRQDSLAAAPALVVVAGMEGALASVVGGLVSGSVIAVPTSVGYGASFGGIAALLAMLNSCAPGVTVVNIDNGFGAGIAAHRIHRAHARGSQT